MNRIPQKTDYTNISESVSNQPDIKNLKSSIANITKFNKNKINEIKSTSETIINKYASDIQDIEIAKTAIIGLAEKKLENIKKSTTGIIAFFRYLFNPSQKKELIDLAKALNQFISEIRNHQPNKDEAKTENTQQLPPPSSGEKFAPHPLSPPQEGKLASPPLPPSHEEKFAPRPLSPPEEGVLASPPLPPSHQEELASSPPISPEEEFAPPPPPPSQVEEFAPPPPPPGQGNIPPPPPPGQGNIPPPPPPPMPKGVPITPLQRQLNERADPKQIFFRKTPPKNERELLEKKGDLTKEINILKEIVNNSGETKTQQPLNELISQKENKLKKTEDELEPSFLPLPYDQKTNKSFMKNYKNTIRMMN